jgi:hypothetical protein
MLNLLTSTKNAFPSSDGVGAYNGTVSQSAVGHAFRKKWFTHCEALKSSPLFSGEPRSSLIKSTPCSATTLKNSGYRAASNYSNGGIIENYLMMRCGQAISDLLPSGR